MQEQIQSYYDSPKKQRELYRRSLVIVVIAQIFGGAGLAAGVTVGALLALDMMGTDSLAGLPSALITLGSAGAAFIVGRLSQRWGRRTGLSAGFLAGGTGAAGVVLAAVADNLTLLFISLVVYGAGTSTNLQARYAGTDLAKPKERARAISIAMVSTTFGAVAGPNLVHVTGEFAESLGIPALAGPFLLAAAAFLLAGGMIWAFLRPDPLLVAIAIANKDKVVAGVALNTEGSEKITRNRGLLIGTTVMVLTQIVMVALMTMMPVHMRLHGHSISEVGLVIGIHIACMFLPSLVTGALTDKFGYTAMSYASGGTLLAAGALGAIVPSHSMLGLVTALALLGIGWNFGLISGTAQIIHATTPDTRAKTQGSIEVLVALAGASGGALSGVIVSHTSYAFLSLTGSLLSLMLIPVILYSRAKST
ncbi:MFS transporter [Paenibacillus swuensis]|uniref:MFS transporter n=1 Tax=Paenibacillus swuensis TaxID=1178515 RepID=A0A172TFW5_9BACL|nr:MFS transporter [Paenibacillus swuensis]ANE45931.1 MFS transporter [Paenibacillus swuensis]